MLNNSSVFSHARLPKIHGNHAIAVAYAAKQLGINAINFAGLSFSPPINNLYGEYRKRNFEEEIADQFAQAIHNRLNPIAAC